MKVKTCEFPTFNPTYNDRIQVFLKKYNYRNLNEKKIIFETRAHTRVKK